MVPTLTSNGKFSKRQFMAYRPDGARLRLPGDVTAGVQFVPDSAVTGMLQASGLLTESGEYMDAYWAETEDGGIEMRYMRGHLSIGPDTVFANLNTPAGIPVSYEHDFSVPTIGKVLSMQVGPGKLNGSIELSKRELSRWYAGGADDLVNGMHRGLSIGFKGIDPAKIKMRGGTYHDPDLFHWNRIEVEEVALTDIPAMKHAGITHIGGDAINGGQDNG